MVHFIHVHIIKVVDFLHLSVTLRPYGKGRRPPHIDTND